MTAAAPIRILSLTLAEETYTNAQQVNAREIASRLDPTKFEVTLLSDGSGPAPIAALAHVRVLRLPARLRALRIFLGLLGGNFDILLYPGAGLPESAFMRLPRWFPGRRARVLSTVEGDVRQLDEVPAWIRRRIDRVHHKADALFPITEHVARGLRERCGRFGEVVPIGVDPVAFSPCQGERVLGPLRVLSVGTVKAWKRPEIVRTAAAALPHASFTWIGEGELRTGESTLAPPNLSFPGAFSRVELAARYRAADVFLHTSRMEGLPKVILEALASGLPIVAFDDYHPTYLAEQGAGFVVGSPEEMVDVLKQLLADDALRRRMGIAARALALRFSWEAVAAQWARIFQREAAIDRRRAPTR